MFTRLQKLGISLSSAGTLRVVDKLGEKHDDEVLKWVKGLLPHVSTTQVYNMLLFVHKHSMHMFKLHYH